MRQTRFSAHTGSRSSANGEGGAAVAEVSGKSPSARNGVAHKNPRPVAANPVKAPPTALPQRSPLEEIAAIVQSRHPASPQPQAATALPPAPVPAVENKSPVDNKPPAEIKPVEIAPQESLQAQVIATTVTPQPIPLPVATPAPITEAVTITPAPMAKPPAISTILVAPKDSKNTSTIKAAPSPVRPKRHPLQELEDARLAAVTKARFQSVIDLPVAAAPAVRIVESLPVFESSQAHSLRRPRSRRQEIITKGLLFGAGFWIPFLCCEIIAMIFMAFHGGPRSAGAATRDVIPAANLTAAR